MKVRVYAKLNLTLAVGTKQGDFHAIDSVVTSVDVFDAMQVTARSDGAVYVTCDLPIPLKNNFAYRAAEAFRNKFATAGVNVVVQKGIPVGAGMGGSSADAAAVVFCMCKLFGIDMFSKEVHALCAELGSDVNFMLRGGLAQMRGKGDDLTFRRLDKPLYFALTVFDRQLSTADIYAAYDALQLKGSMTKGSLRGVDLLNFLADGVFSERKQNVCSATHSNADGELGDLFFNDLELVARKTDDYASDYIEFVKQKGYKCTLTGSGSAYYIAFRVRAEAERIAAELNAAGFSTRLCRSVSDGITET